MCNLNIIFMFLNTKMMLRLHIHLYCNFHHYLNLQGPPEASTGCQRLPRAFKDLQEPLGTYRDFQGPPGTSGALQRASRRTPGAFRSIQGPPGTFRDLQGHQGKLGAFRGPLKKLQGSPEAFRASNDLQELPETSRNVKGN